MNTYEITFTRKNGKVGTDRITAVTEGQAREDFEEVYRHGDRTITNIELISTYTPSTKEQEREALVKIRKIIAELGENSYIGTAFEGCLQDAESNIDNDFGDSMKARYEYSEKKMVTAQEEIRKLKGEIEESEKNHRTADIEAHELLERKDAEIKTLREHTLLADDLVDVLQLVSEKRFDFVEEVKNAAERIVEAAAEPESAAFKNAVSDHRAAVRNAEYYTALEDRLRNAQKK